MPIRRSLVLAAASWGALLAAPSVRAQQRRSLNDPLRWGVDSTLVDSGLARALQKGFGRDTGVVVNPIRMSALPLLDALERGEFDAAMTNAEAAETQLDKQGLVHDRQAVALGDFVIVGPPGHGRTPDIAGIANTQDAAAALVRIRDAALASAPGDVVFMSAGDGSGTHVVEQALWRVAKIAPAAPWYVNAGTTTAMVAQARARNAYAVVERGAWSALGGKPPVVMVQGDPLLAEPIHVMRSFRVNHPAGKMFVAWICGPKGRRLVGSLHGYRAPAA